MKEIKRGEIYYANLCPVVGSEQGGIRPVIILQNDVGNRHSPTTIVAAITRKRGKSELPTHVSIRINELGHTSVALLEQIRTIDKSRIKDFVGVLDVNTMEHIDRAILISLGVTHVIGRNKSDGGKRS